jgi:hypothetical protein
MGHALGECRDGAVARPAWDIVSRRDAAGRRGVAFAVWHARCSGWIAMEWRSALVLHHQRRRMIARVRATMQLLVLACAVLGGIGVYIAFRTAPPHDASNRPQRTAVQLAQAIEMYRTLMRGRCPPDLDALKATDIVSRVRDDPWGRAYRFECPHSDHLAGGRVVSAGPDGIFGSPDDIDNDRNRDR